MRKYHVPTISDGYFPAEVPGRQPFTFRTETADCPLSALVASILESEKSERARFIRDSSS